MIFQNSLIKSLIHKIKKINISRNFSQLQIDEIENKMSKIIKKIKKQIINRKILKKKYFTCQYFFKRTFRIFQKSLVKSLTLRIKHHKNFDNFWTS